MIKVILIFLLIMYLVSQIVHVVRRKVASYQAAFLAMQQEQQRREREAGGQPPPPGRGLDLRACDVEDARFEEVKPRDFGDHRP